MSIEWADRTWNPVRGCSRVSEGCRNCYAERQAERFSSSTLGGRVGPFAGFVSDHGWTGRVEMVPEKLAEPLKWRKPCRVFVNSMSDLFHEALPFEAIDRVFAVMALASMHTFQVLTKRPERMREYVLRRLAYEDFIVVVSQFVGHDSGDVDGICDAAWNRFTYGIPNLWLGVSVEDQATADARVPKLLATPAAKRFVSYEPALGPVDFTGWFEAYMCDGGCDLLDHPHDSNAGIDWLIVGGESGPKARPCDVAWIRSTVRQCQGAGVPVFVKQAGSNSISRCAEDFGEEQFRSWDSEHANEPFPLSGVRVPFRSRNGSDPSEWPEDLRVLEVPT